MSDLVERLRYTIRVGMDRAGTIPAKDAVKVRPKDWHAITDAGLAAADALASQATLIAELQGALKPFADAADDLDDNHMDFSPIWETPSAMGIDARHLRAARTALKGGLNGK